MNRERGFEGIICLLAFTCACVGFWLQFSFAGGEDRLADLELLIITSTATGILCFAVIWFILTFIVWLIFRCSELEDEETEKGLE
ncbi:MAG: hypothetical protein ACYSUK_11445 [Planctomycetota bacterium]|jgi:hypothetical protein